MKIQNIILAAFACIFAMAACTEEEDLAPDIQISTNSLDFSEEAGSKTLTLTATREWKVEYDAEWLSVTPSSNAASSQTQTITITVQDNSEENDVTRTAKLVFTIGLVQQTLTVTQVGPKGGNGDGIETLTVAEFIERADENKTYRLTGVVASSVNTQYCSFDLQDETGKIVVWTVNNAAEWGNVVKMGGTVTLRGVYKLFINESGATKHEVVDAYIEEFIPGEEEDLSKVETVTCAQFIQNADPTKTYRLVGAVASAVNAEYCSFDLNDGTGTVVVWTVNNKDEWVNVVKQGGTVTVRGKYYLYTNATTGATKHEMVDAYIEDFEEVKAGADLDNASISDVVNATVGTKATMNDMLVVATYTRGYLISDGTDYLVVYANAETPAKVGDKVNVSGTKAEYNGFAQLSSPTTTVTSSGNAVTHPQAKDITSTFDSYSSSRIEYITYTGILAVSGNYYNVNVEGASSRTGSVQYPAASLGLDSYDGIPVTITGYFMGISSNKYVNVMAVEVVPASDFDYITLSETSLNFPSAGGELSFTINSNVAAEDISVTVSDEDQFSVSVSGNVVTVTANANAGGVISATITVSGGNVTKTIAVSQSSEAQENAIELTFPDENSANNKISAYNETWTAKSGNMEWDITSFNNNNWNNSWTYIRCGSKNAAYDGTIATTTAISAKISTVIVEMDKCDQSLMTTSSLIVATDASFSNVVETVVVTPSAGTLEYSIANPTANCYYKLVYPCSQGSKNGFGQISKVQYVAE